MRWTLRGFLRERHNEYVSAAEVNIPNRKSQNDGFISICSLPRSASVQENGILRRHRCQKDSAAGEAPVKLKS